VWFGLVSKFAQNSVCTGKWRLLVMRLIIIQSQLKEDGEDDTDPLPVEYLAVLISMGGAA
jgi:hypothetical protein